jgi:hypothetical protein
MQFQPLPEAVKRGVAMVLLIAHLNTCRAPAPSNFREFPRNFVNSQERTFRDA